MQTMTTVTTDIFIVQGTTYKTTFDIKEVESYAFYATIRKHHDDTPFMEFSVDIDPIADNVTFSLSSDQTISLYPKTYLYQISAKSLLDDSVFVFAQGNAIVDPGVTFIAPGASDGEIIVDGGTF